MQAPSILKTCDRAGVTRPGFVTIAASLLLLWLSVVTHQAAVTAFAPRINYDTSGTNTTTGQFGQAPSRTSPDFQFNGFISLSGLTNQLTIDGSNLLLDGVPIGGVTSYVSNFFTIDLTVTNSLTVLSNLFASNLFTINLTVTNNLTVLSNLYTSNFYAYDVTVTNSFTVLSNFYTSNFFAVTVVITNNLTVLSNLYTSNFFAIDVTVTNSLTVQSNLYVSNLIFTNLTGTIDATGTNVTLIQRKSLKLQFPRYIDGSGCTYSNTNDFTSATFMVPRFSGTAATNANYCVFGLRVPDDLDTSQDLTASLSVVLTGADTDSSTYTVGMVSVSNSADWLTAPAHFVALTIPSDAGGGSGNVESINAVTLTDWSANLIPDEWWLIKLQRDGAGDTSNVSHDFVELEISYISTQ